MDCAKCAEPVKPTASKCPNCGYEPSADGSTARTIALFVGIGLTLTGVGAVIGIPLLLVAWYGHKQAENLTPANPT